MRPRHLTDSAIPIRRRSRVSDVWSIPTSFGRQIHRCWGRPAARSVFASCSIACLSIWSDASPPGVGASATGKCSRAIATECSTILALTAPRSKSTAALHPGACASPIDIHVSRSFTQPGWSASPRSLLVGAVKFVARPQCLPRLHFLEGTNSHHAARARPAYKPIHRTLRLRCSELDDSVF